MKKLMVAIAAVASAFGLYAADLETGTSFEALETGAFDWTKDDAGQSNAPWWFTTETEVEGTVTEYAGDAYAGPRPDKFEGKDTQLKFLALETSKPLYRGATTLNTTSEVVTVDNAFGPQDIGTGFYVDQLVKFTAPSDSEATIDLAGGKIALWLQEVELEENVTATNLMVTAGFFTEGSVTVQSNYVATLAGGADAASLVGSWHRVTIKAIPATTDDIAGFIVYIDGVAVTTADAIAGDGVEPSYSTLGAKYEALDQLFPSAVFSGDSALTIAAVGFQGSGAIDDVSLTTIVPSFAKDDLTFDLDWDPEKITAITAGDKELTDGELALGAIQLTLPPNTTSLEVIATPVEGYTASLVAKNGCEVDEDGKTFTFETSAEGSIVATRNFFEVNGVGYPTFAAALAAAEEGDTITLKDTCTIDATGEDYETPLIENDITLDLAGNDLYINDDTPICELGANLTLINSGDDAKIGIDAETQDSALFSGANLIVGTPENQDQMGFVIFDAMVIDGDDPTVYQAKIAKEYNTDPNTFIVPEGYKMDTESDEDYYIVKKEGGPEPKFVIEIVGGERYETIDEALAAANDDDELKLLKSVTLDDTLVIDKAIKFDLNDCEIELASDKNVGIDITADATVKNGGITGTFTANVVGSKAINIPNKNVTLEDVVIDASFYEYVVYANCDEASAGNLEWFYTDTDDKFATLNCESVCIMGNGSLFHIEGMRANLNECDATYDSFDLFANEAHRAAVYSAVNALTTITGSGDYEHENALQSGNLGGKIIVAADSTATFKGDIKSWMKVGAHSDLEKLDNYAASFIFNGGTYDGEIVFVDADARNLDYFLKSTDVKLDAPAGYQWNETTGVLEKIPPAPVTYTVTFNTNNFAYVTFDAVTNNTPFADLLAEFAEPQIDGYTFKGWTPVVEFITSNSTFEAILEKAGDYPSEDWPDADKAVKEKFSAWRADPDKGAGADLGTDIAKKAFLLNCSVDEAENTELKIESITVDADGYATIEVKAPLDHGFNIDLGEINGVLYVEAGDKIETMQPRAITYWTTTSGKANVTVQYNFIKAAVGFKKPEVDATEKPPMAEE